MPELPTGVVAFLFADLENAAGGWDTDYLQTAGMVQQLVTVLQTAAHDQDGAVFKVIGESAQAAFPDVSRALSAAIATLEDLVAPWPADQLPRMAIHIGEATPSHGDYLAPALNRLARLTAASHAGQILLTEAARAQLGEAPCGVAYVDLGRHRLRDLLAAEPVFQVNVLGLPDAFPPLRSLDGSPHNLPVQPTRLVGRETDLARVRDALRAGNRLITLLGPGGVGKSRLSLQVGADELDSFPDGVWWAPLASITDPGLVLEAIASAMPLRLPVDVPLADALPGLLRSRRDLLILDNLEQVPGAAPIIAALLEAAPATVALVTSRLPLGLPGETTLLIEPLSVPDAREVDSVTVALASPAVQLFMERAVAVRPGFELTAENVQDIAGICDHLDGLPLAIELAAARIRVLTPAAILTRLDRSLSLLTGGARDLPVRQQTLRGAIQWSFDLLSPAERTAFARLAVMAPGFTTDAVSRTFQEYSGSVETIGSLESLREQSLVRKLTGRDGSVRWEMLSTIREFALECFQKLAEAPALRLAHAHAYLATAEDSEWFEVTNQPELAESFEADLDNYRLALRTFQDQHVAGARDMLRLATMLADFWWVRGHATEGRQWLESAIAHAGSQHSLDLGRALAAAGLLAEAQSDLAAARHLQERALDVFRSEGFASGVADSLTGLAVIARAEGDLNRARVLHQEAYDVWTALGDDQGAAGALLDIGAVSLLRGDLDNAEPTLRSALSRFQAADDEVGEAHARQALAVVAASDGRLSEAKTEFQEAIKMWRALGNEQMVTTGQMNLAELLLLQGEPQVAEALLLEAISRFAELADPARQGSATSLLGRARLQQGLTAEAEALQRDALKLSWENHDLQSAAGILDALAETVATMGDQLLGRDLFRASEQLRAQSGLMRFPEYTRRLTGLLGELPSETTVDDQSPRQTIERVIYRGLRR
ncbi:MAG: tetratricopeptide repeat protein [Thermomicrobiales bacterium]